jgi:signal transduction histidine kinase
VEVAVEGNDVLGRLVVRDRGMGIPARDLERIFDRYEQSASARGHGGLGLGLYIARQIVDAHGGTLRVESTPGAGSTFTVELPVEPSPSSERPSARPCAEQPGRPAEDVAREAETAAD